MFASALLVACSTRMGALNKTTNALFFSNEDPSATATLNPNIRYLRVHINGRVVLLALGYIDSHVLGSIEVWYSAKGEVLRLQNGHLLSLTGSSDEWRASELSSMPDWPLVNALPITYTRSRDVMPGYHFGVFDRLSLRAVSIPTQSRLVAIAPTTLRWFEALEERQALPPARFAVMLIAGKDVAIYGEQCVSTSVCLSWQHWPPKVPT